MKAAMESGPQPAGDIEIPVAKENCLAGLTFVFTGLLPRIPREQAQNLVKHYGGRVTTAPSSKTSCVVIGNEAGPSKIAKIKKMKIKAIDEDGFLQLLREMPANGGSGEAAQKALIKKQEEEEKVTLAIEDLAESLKQKYKDNKIGEKSDLWTTKYDPMDLSEICGNKGQIEKLSNWLDANALRTRIIGIAKNEGIDITPSVSDQLSMSANHDEVRLQYLPLLMSYKLIDPILAYKEAGIDEVMELMDSYHLTKDDWSVAMDLSVGDKSYAAKAKNLSTGMKSAFTRNYNKTPHPVPYMKSAAMFTAKATAATLPAEVPDLVETLGEEREVEEVKVEDENDLTKDKYVKEAKKPVDKKVKKRRRL
ncbi:hypothetical protein DV452_000332 [Geotrichum candidum]|nr:hypothetical protein DV452_000332 [Geotrichum candidum]